MRLTEAEQAHIGMGHMDVLRRVLVREEAEARSKLVDANMDNFRYWQAHCKLLGEILSYME